MRTRHISFGLLFCVTAIAACKKDKNEPSEPVVNCDIVTEMRLDANTNSYEYDAEDRLVKVLVNGAESSTLVYEDGGNKVVETEPNAIITYTIGSNGRASSKTISFSGGQVQTSFYTYDVNKLLTRTILHSFGVGSNVPQKDTVFYTNTVANGNLVQLVSNGENGQPVIDVTLTYDLTKPNNIVEPRPFSPENLLGYNKNLPATMQLDIDGEITNGNFVYEHDSKGRVTKRTTNNTSQGNPPSESVTTYKYRCD